MEHANGNGGAVKQRIHRSELEILKHLADQEASEFNVREYCEMFDINEQTFNSWLRKYKSSPGGEGNGFALVEIIPSATTSQLFAEVNGIKLYKEVPAEYLKALVS